MLRFATESMPQVPAVSAALSGRGRLAAARGLIALVMLLAAAGLLLFSCASAAAPGVSLLNSPASALLYDKFEATFSVSTIATNLMWPYDPDPVANSRPAWSSTADYSLHDRVTRGATVYRCVKDTEREWRVGELYRPYDSDIASPSSPRKLIRYNGGLYKNVSPYPSDIATAANGPGGASSLWQYVGPDSPVDREPGGPGNWQSYWAANPPDPVPAGVGISVDGLFLPPGETNWDAAVVQPGFLYQDFTSLSNYTKHDDQLVTVGEPVWKLRFSPTRVGTWQWKIRLTDASGTAVYNPPAGTFECLPSDKRGFVRVSPNDTRYFETSDGKYLNIVGVESMKFPNPVLGGTWDHIHGISDYRNAFPFAKSQGINLIRFWWSEAGLNGIGGQGGYGAWSSTLLASSAEDPQCVSRPGELFSFAMESGSNVTKSSRWVWVKPNTKYRLSGWVRTVDVTGTGDYGVGLAVGPCVEVWSGDQIVTSKVRGNTDWTLLSADITTRQDQGQLWFHVMRANTTSGKVYFTDVSLREVLGGGRLGGEVNQEYSPNRQLLIARQDKAYELDYQVELARQNGVYLKAPVASHIDWCFGRIGANGEAAAGSPSNAYAWPTHATRTYMRYYWRYLIARYGYATSIHSLEFTNEGDPFNGQHYECVQAMARFFKDNDPNQHLVTASCWHSFPTWEFWGNPQYPDVAYADIHRYDGPPAEWTCRQYQHGWKTEVAKSSTDYVSAPYSLHLQQATRSDLRQESLPLAVTPGHRYTLGYWAKGRGIVGNSYDYSYAGGPNLGVFIRPRTGWWATIVGPMTFFTDQRPPMLGTFDWVHHEFTFQTTADTQYLEIMPSMHLVEGEAWFDDITLRDDTTGQQVYVPNGDFDEGRVDYDIALVNYCAGAQVGYGSARALNKPVIDANAQIVDLTRPSDQWFNPSIDDDTGGTWYRKFVWSQVNRYGVISLYYNAEINLTHFEFLRQAKVYQDFMDDVELSNGRYQDAEAVVLLPGKSARDSAKEVRVWGQKDLVSNRAHLWIDNISYTWKACADGVTPGTGPLAPHDNVTITLSGFNRRADGVFVDGPYSVEWWNTSTGERSTEEVMCRNGTIQITVPRLLSDTACKIRPKAEELTLQASVLSHLPPWVYPGEVVDVVTSYSNVGGRDLHDPTVEVALPPEMEYVLLSAEASGGSYDPVVKRVVWFLGDVPVGAGGTLVFRARIK